MDSSVESNASSSSSSERIRMVVESAENNTASTSKRYVKEGSFVMDTEQKDFTLSNIKNSVVPEDVGSAVPLDESAHFRRNQTEDDDYDDYEEDDEYYHTQMMESSSSLHRNQSTKSKNFDIDSEDDDHSDGDDDEDIEDPRESRRKQAEGVLFSQNDLENYDKYHRASSSITSGAQRKKTILYGCSTLLAVCLTAGLGVVLMGKIQHSDGQSKFANVNEKTNSQTNHNQQNNNPDWWDNADGNTDADVQDVTTVSTFIDDDPDGGVLDYQHLKPPPNNGNSPPELASLAHTADPYDFDTDIPFLWMIPRTSTLQVRDIIGHCFHHHFARQYRGPDQGADTVFNHLLYKVANSFIPYYPNIRGRMFTMMRDPMLRTVDMWISHREEEGNISLEDYLRYHHDNNWMTRFLSNNFDQALTSQDLEMAKTILREKTIIGLDEAKQVSFNRLVHYFHWDDLNIETQQCIRVVMQAPGYEDLTIQYPQEFSPEYDLLQSRNHMDTPLYEYAKELYADQTKTLFQDLV